MEYMSELLHILSSCLTVSAAAVDTFGGRASVLSEGVWPPAILVGIGGVLEYIKYGGPTDIGSWGPLAAIGSWGPLATIRTWGPLTTIGTWEPLLAIGTWGPLAAIGSCITGLGTSVKSIGVSRLLHP